MPFYLSEYVGAGTRPDPFQPVGFDQPGWSAIDLRADPSQPGGNVLLWVPTAFADGRAHFLADDKLEALTNPQKNFLQNRLGVDLSSPTLLRDIIATLMTNPPVNGWKGIRPTRLKWEIWLGGLLWEAPRASGGASDDFNRANETPLASPWTKHASSHASNANLASNVIAGSADGDKLYWYPGAASSADQFAQIKDLVSGGVDGGPAVRIAGSGAFDAYMVVPTLGVYAKFNSNAFASLGSTGGTHGLDMVNRVEVEGSSIRAYIEGVATPNTATDTTIAGAGNGSGFFLYQTAPAFDDWAGGDLVQATGALNNMRFERYPKPVLRSLRSVGSKVTF